MINVIKRFYIVCVALSMIGGMLFASQAAASEQMLAIFNALITTPILAYIFYKTIRFIFYGH